MRGRKQMTHFWRYTYYAGAGLITGVMALGLVGWLVMGVQAMAWLSVCGILGFAAWGAVIARLAGDEAQAELEELQARIAELERLRDELERWRV